MMDTEILELLEDIGRTSTARLSPAVLLAGDTAQERRQSVLGTIRGTVLPRRLEFTAANGDCLAIEVNSSRITDVFRDSTGDVPDFETEPRDEMAGRLAQLVSDIAAAPGPLELISKRPETAMEADDVGITYSEVETACAGIDLPEEPRVAIVPDVPEEVTKDAPAEDTGAASRFYENAAAFAKGRALFDGQSGEDLKFDGICAPGQPAHPDQDILHRFARDLAGWDVDTNGALSRPQLVVFRPSGGQGTGLALLRDGQQTAAALHDARKLGAVVNLWKSFKGVAE
ncbi:hypothetical protein [Ruegeria sp.]|uniref:hypothetical protein n=1 Tax=Ruegeria sp. TaxID=1879320 RepID=UPI00232494C0|nr:hypothetical protein [Ruegeria sp.]MDA7965145.1 hypothetical protein [Ruegeria sp.]